MYIPLLLGLPVGSNTQKKVKLHDMPPTSPLLSCVALIKVGQSIICEADYK